MHVRKPIAIAALVASVALPPLAVHAQTAVTTTAQRALAGLAPFSTLLNTAAGQVALHANLIVTSAIQTGTAGQPGLQPFALQQGQALKDATITDANALELADGLGTTLAAAYQQLGTCSSADDGPAWPTCSFTDAKLASLAGLIDDTDTLTGNDSNAGKFAFANASTGSAPASPDAKAALAAAGGTTDVLGKTYLQPVCRTSVDPYGDSRPFQTEKQFLEFSGVDYFAKQKTNLDYLCGPIQDLRASPSFPSGHTTYGYTESLLLALVVPERYAQMVVRAAEYGNSRIILGAHYAMDVIGGRTLAEYDLAHLLASDPAYVGQQFAGATPIAHYRDALTTAATDLRHELAARCGAAIAACAQNDQSRFRDATVNAAFYESTQTYGLPVVYPQRAGTLEDVATIAPEAGTLLTAAFPALSLAQADRILTQTEGPGGGFLDNGSAFGVYSRLDLYRAAIAARASV